MDIRARLVCPQPRTGRTVHSARDLPKGPMTNARKGKETRAVATRDCFDRRGDIGHPFAFSTSGTRVRLPLGSPSKSTGLTRRRIAPASAAKWVAASRSRMPCDTAPSDARHLTNPEPHGERDEGVATAVLLALVLLCEGGSSLCLADSYTHSVDGGRLVALAAVEFPNLTKAERALLEFVDARNRARGDFAAAGPSAVPTDLS